jgi:hypothetical protein
MEEAFKHIEQIPPSILMAAVFLIFLLQLLKFSFELVSKRFEKKERIEEREANKGINHLAIYERIGKHEDILIRVMESVNEMKTEVHAARNSIKSLEQNFQDHTESDKAFATIILKRLTDLIKPKKPIKRKK